MRLDAEHLFRNNAAPIGNLFPVCATWEGDAPVPWMAVTPILSGVSAGKGALQHRGMLLAKSTEQILRATPVGMKDRWMDLRDQRVQFKICDVYHPDPTQVLVDLHGHDFLVGKVVDLSDSGTQRDAFVVVEVEGIVELMIVPVECILSIP